jgi:hypothetical protein
MEFIAAAVFNTTMTVWERHELKYELLDDGPDTCRRT